MNLINHSENVIEIGRALGYDFALYGKEPRDSDLPGVAEGFAEGKRSIGSSKKPADRFVNKHLQLRSNALRRGKSVDASVTVELLRNIDYETCPVTLEKLTHGENKETDWSIDRINNNGAYATDNIAVLSTRANKAKGSKTFEEVFELANSDVEKYGLTPREWLRMATIMFGPCAVENQDILKKLPLPLATRIPSYTSRPLYFQLQRLVLDAAKTSTNRGRVLKLIKKIDRAGLVQFDLVVHQVSKNMKSCKYEYDSLIDESVQTRLYTWLDSLSKSQYISLKSAAVMLLGGEPLKTKTVEGWSLGTHGKLP